MTSTLATAEVIGVVAERLGGLPHLGSVSPECREALAGRGILRSFEREEEILAESQATESLFILLRGRVKMSRATAVGRTVILALFSPGEVFGAVATLATGVSDASITALEESQCLEVPRRALYGLFTDHSELIDQLLPLLARQLVECKNCVVEMTGYRVEIRFAHIFLKLGDHIGRPQNDGLFIPLRLSRQELADMTGTAIETCIRLMSRWRTEDILETRGDGFLIRDRAALQLLAQG